MTRPTPDNWEPLTTEWGEAAAEWDTAEKSVPVDQGDVPIKDRAQFLEFMENQYRIIDSIQELMGGLPKPNCQVRAISRKSFNPFAFLLYVADASPVVELFMAIYRIDIKSVQGLKNLVESGKVKNLTIVLSSFHKGSAKVEKWHLALKSWAEQMPNVRLIYCWTHAKIIAAHTENDDYFVIEGSGNLSSNARIEQYLFENRRESFEFHKTWMEDVRSISAKNDVSELVSDGN